MHTLYIVCAYIDNFTNLSWIGPLKFYIQYLSTFVFLFKKSVLGTTGYYQLKPHTAVYLAFNHAKNC